MAETRRTGASSACRLACGERAALPRTLASKARETSDPCSSSQPTRGRAPTGGVPLCGESGSRSPPKRWSSGLPADRSRVLSISAVYGPTRSGAHGARRTEHLGVPEETVVAPPRSGSGRGRAAAAKQEQHDEELVDEDATAEGEDQDQQDDEHRSPLVASRPEPTARQQALIATGAVPVVCSRSARESPGGRCGRIFPPFGTGWSSFLRRPKKYSGPEVTVSVSA